MPSGGDLPEQGQPVSPHALVLSHDEDIVEEDVDRADQMLRCRQKVGHCCGRAYLLAEPLTAQQQRNKSACNMAGLVTHARSLRCSWTTQECDVLRSAHLRHDALHCPVQHLLFRVLEEGRVNACADLIALRPCEAHGTGQARHHPLQAAALSGIKLNLLTPSSCSVAWAPAQQRAINSYTYACQKRHAAAVQTVAQGRRQIVVQ